MQLDFPLPISAESLQVIYEAMGEYTFPILLDDLSWEIVNNMDHQDLEKRLLSQVYEQLSSEAYQQIKGLIRSFTYEEAASELQEMLSSELADLVGDDLYLDVLSEALETLPYISLEKLIDRAYELYLSDMTKNTQVDDFLKLELEDYSLGPDDPLDDNYLFSLN